MKKIAIVGSGIAGLAASIRLRNSGYEVDVFEANEYPGGKLSQVKLGAYRFDAGPSLFTMPHFVDAIFLDTNKNPEDYFTYFRKEIICKYFYEDGTKFTAYSDKNKFAKHASEVFKTNKEEILNYFANNKKKYDLTASLFLEKSLHKAETFLNKQTVKALANLGSLDVLSTLNTVNENAFSDARLVQFFNRFATYNGSSPYLTPGIMSMIPHLEQHFGTFFPVKGMHHITMSLYKLATEIGVNFFFNHKVEEIKVKNKKTEGVIANGAFHASDIVISNMDVVPTYRKLLKNEKAPEKVLTQERSSSALIFYWGIKKQFKELDLHNIFFSENYKEEFDTIFQKQEIYEDPTVYINITSKEKKDDAPKDCETWFVMINVPGNTGQNWKELVSKSRQQILKKLSRLLQVNIEELIEEEAILDPVLIEQKTQSYQGSLYGAASNNKFAAFLRHPNFSQRIENLYFCGGSVHPGGGIPLCLLSGKIVTELIEKKYN
ncbi:1-hydroxycarotenoid 3,4-desaturase CrtD [Ascidiimonas sp. W6]|uniref:1-hydroxycarotenoid 3,4-desaturase CrtD n=1 Tax=Ascidiimonas meishanensis TaxID=3128903 RepID=UPI0030EE7924